MWAGKDLQAGGTWLGFGKDGQFALLTNFRKIETQQYSRSRGELVVMIFTYQFDEKRISNWLSRHGNEFAGFNLFWGDKKRAYFFENHQKKQVKPLVNNVFTLSNSTLNSPWYKQKKLFTFMLKSSPINIEAAFKHLSEVEKAPEDILPETGFGLEKEHFLSSTFIRDLNYGTRSSVVAQWRNDCWHIEERLYSPEGKVQKVQKLEVN
jgi:uncharacterized protein with NRDE domain